MVTYSSPLLRLVHLMREALRAAQSRSEPIIGNHRQSRQPAALVHLEHIGAVVSALEAIILLQHLDSLFRGKGRGGRCLVRRVAASNHPPNVARVRHVRS